MKEIKEIKEKEDETGGRTGALQQQVFHFIPCRSGVAVGRCGWLCFQSDRLVILMYLCMCSLQTLCAFARAFVLFVCVCPCPYILCRVVAFPCGRVSSGRVVSCRVLSCPILSCPARLAWFCPCLARV